MKIKNPFNWNLRFGTIPSEFKEAMTYEEQIQWLYYQLKELKEGTANYNYDLLENKPSIDGIILQGNVTKTQLGIDSNYYSLINKPSINNVTLSGNKSLNDLGIQAKLIEGPGINISGNTISAIGGGSGTTDYNLLSNKPSINDVALQGNLRSDELGLQPTLNVELTNYVAGKGLYLVNVNEGDVYLPPYDYLLSASGSDLCYIIIPTIEGTHVDIKGKYQLVKLSSSNSVVSIFSTNNIYEHGYFDSSSEGTLIISFSDIENYPPSVELIETGKGNYNEEKTINENINETNSELQKLLEKNIGYIDYSSDLETGKIYVVNVDNSISEISNVNSASFIADARILYSLIYIKGMCLDYASILFADSDYNLISSEPANQIYYQLIQKRLMIPENCRYVIFNFTNINELSPSLKLLDIDKFYDDVYILREETILNSNGTISVAGDVYDMKEGFYLVLNNVFVGSASPSNLMYSNGEIIYYLPSEKRFFGSFKSVSYDTLDSSWYIDENQMIENSLTNSRNKIPTSQAVTQAIQGIAPGGTLKYYVIDQLKTSDPSDFLDIYQNGIIYIKEFFNEDEDTVYQVDLLYYYNINRWVNIGTRTSRSTNSTNKTYAYLFENSVISYYSSKWNYDDSTTFNFKSLWNSKIEDNSPTDALINVNQLKNYVNPTIDLFNLLLENQPNKEVEGSILNLNDSSNLPLKNFEIEGNLYQETTSISEGDEYNSPSPDHPQPIQVPTGNNTIKTLSKNFLNLPIIQSYSSNGIISSCDGKNITLSGTTTGAWFNILSSSFTNFNLPIGRYLLSWNSSVVTRLTFTLKYEDESTSGSSFIISSGRNYAVVETTKKAIGYRFFTDGSVADTPINGMIKELMLEKMETGTTRGNYKLYDSQTNLISLDNMILPRCKSYYNRIYKDNNKWYFEEQVQKRIFNGSDSENWELSNNVFYISNPNALIGDGNFAKSNYFIGASNQASTTNVNTYNADNSICGAKSSTSRIYIKCTSITSVDNFKAFLNDHNLIVYYPLATPIITEITDSALISQLNEAEKMHTYIHDTNIFNLTENLDPIYKINYYQNQQAINEDLQNQINDLEARVTILET